MAENGFRSARDQVLQELRSADKLVVVTHENPDGDALGSLIAMDEILRTLGKDSQRFIDNREFPLPPEYRFLPLDGVVTEPPEDVADRTIVFLDCGNLERNPAEAFRRPGMHLINIDHHHDNTQFGTVNLVDATASCTAEIVWDLMGELGVEPTQSIAEALYVGLITDTGRFMYENTTARSHLMAADLLAAGVEPQIIYRHVYEEMPYGKLVLLARALARVERYDDGLLTLTQLSAEDFTAAEAEESFSEGVIDHLRAVAGTAVAGLVRDRVGDDTAAAAGVRKVSLRANDARVDVSRIAREQGGGGHRQAAGFSTTLGWDELVQFLRTAITEQLAAA